MSSQNVHVSLIYISASRLSLVSKPSQHAGFRPFLVKLTPIAVGLLHCLVAELPSLIQLLLRVLPVGTKKAVPRLEHTELV